MSLKTVLKSWVFCLLVFSVFVFGIPFIANGASHEKTVTVATAAELGTFDPGYETMLVNVGTIFNVFDPLVRRDALQDMEIVPALATSWEFIEPTKLRMELREGVKFHDGKEMTADDVVFTFSRLLEEALPLSTYVEDSILKVEKVDDYTVIVSTPRPHAVLLPSLAVIPIIPKETFQEMGSDAFGMNPVGTGPFTFDFWQKDDRIELVSFEDYWRGRPQIDRLIIKPIPESFSRFAAFRQGEVDIMVNLPPVRAPLVEADEDLEVRSVVTSRNMFVWINTYIPPFDDLRVRKALNYGIDSQELVETVLGGFGEPNPSAFNKTIIGHDPNIEPYDYDPEKAKELLAEAGYPDGFELTLWGSEGRYIMDRQMQEAIGGQLSKIGINVRHHIVEWAEFWGNVSAERVEGLIYIGTGNNLLDADMTLGYRFHSARGGRYYQNDELDKLIEKQQAEIDYDKRMEILSEIQQIIREDAPWVFLHDVEDVYGVNKRIDWQPRPDEMIFGFDMSLND